jgi:hypothetical protein
MAFKIMPFGGQQYRGQYANHYDIRQYLGFKANAKLPMDFEERITVPLQDGRTTQLIVTKGRQSTIGRCGKSSTHRCFARCPDCHALVPAGRTVQHKC